MLVGKRHAFQQQKCHPDKAVTAYKGYIRQVSSKQAVKARSTDCDCAAWAEPYASTS